MTNGETSPGPTIRDVPVISDVGIMPADDRFIGAGRLFRYQKNYTAYEADSRHPAPDRPNNPLTWQSPRRALDGRAVPDTDEV
jgi:hypothetical protein